MNENSRAYKVVLCGDSGVGKSCFIERLVFQKYTGGPGSTAGCSNTELIYPFDSQIIKFDIWDIAGQEVYKSLLPIYNKGTDIVILIYDVSNNQSLPKWYELVNEKQRKEISILNYNTNYSLCCCRK